MIQIKRIKKRSKKVLAEKKVGKEKTEKNI